MSSSQCRDGDTIGFPQRLSQRLDSTWPATSDAQGQLRKLVVPTDFTIQWGGMQTQSVKIDVTNTIGTYGKPGVFQIRGINTITDATTINYGPASYSCSSVLSIVQNQHKTMSSDNNSLYEVILAFQINNKSINPSSPDIILLCRPLVFTSSASNTPFWSAVFAAAKAELAYEPADCAYCVPVFACTYAAFACNDVVLAAAKAPFAYEDAELAV
jgi:hypothetical protein